MTKRVLRAGVERALNVYVAEIGPDKAKRLRQRERKRS